MIYFIDTDSFIALRRIYTPKHFQPLWDDIEILISNGHLLSTRINYEELKITDDLLFSEWKNKNKEMFIEIDEDIQSHVTKILDVLLKLLYLIFLYL